MSKMLEGTSVVSEKDLSREMVRGFKWSSISVVLRLVLQLAVLSVLARLLSPEEFGLAGMATIFTSFFERVGFLGVGPAVVQKERLSAKEVSICFSISLLLGVGLTALMFFGAPAIAALFREQRLVPLVQVLSVVFVLESASSISESLLQRNLRFKRLMVITNTAYFVGNGVVGIALAYAGFGVWSLVFAAIALRIVKTSLMFAAAPNRPALRFGWRDCRELIRLGFGFSLGRLLSIGALYGDNFIVGRVLGAAALGMYGRSYQLMTLPSTYFGQILEKVMFPVMAKRQSSAAELRQMLLFGIECAALVGMPASVFVILNAREIILFLFGAKWEPAIPVLQLLAAATFPRLCYKNSDTVLRSLGAVYRHAARQGLYAALVLGGSAVGSRWGLEGVAIAVSAAVAINYLVLSQLGLKLLGGTWREFAAVHLPAAWASLWVVAGLALFVPAARAAGLAPFPLLCGSAVVCAVSFLCALRLSPLFARPKAAASFFQARSHSMRLSTKVAAWVFSAS